MFRRSKQICIEKQTKDEWIITLMGVKPQLYLDMRGMPMSERLVFLRWSILAEGCVWTSEVEKIVMKNLGLKRGFWAWFWEKDL